MKKLIALALVAVTLIFALASCSKKCDICGESGAKSVEILGETLNICDDCASGKSFGM